MRSVIMVAACPFPAGYGSPASIRELAVILGNRGYDVHVATYPFGDGELSVGKAHVWRTPYWRSSRATYTGPSWEKLILDFLLLIRLCSVIRREHIDIIHAHNYEGAVIGIVAKFLTGRPLVYQAVNLMSDELPTYNFIKPAFLAKALGYFLDWFVPMFPDHVIAISEELNSYFMKRGFTPENLALIPPGVHPEMFDGADPSRFRTYYSAGSRPVVIYTGVNNVYQRIDHLLRAFSLVVEKEPSAVLMVVSPLSREPGLQVNRSLARTFNLSEKVIWVESQALADLPDYLAMADVTVIPRPDMPGYPLKLLNCMAASKPVVCFAGAAKGVTHLHDGFVVPDHDWTAMGQAIVKILRDPELARTLGANARRTVLARFDWQFLCTEIEAVYGVVLSARRRLQALGRERGAARAAAESAGSRGWESAEE